MLSARWTEANDTGALPPGLTGHVAAVWRSSLYIHGGIAQDGWLCTRPHDSRRCANP